MNPLQGVVALAPTRAKKRLGKKSNPDSKTKNMLVLFGVVWFCFGRMGQGASLPNTLGMENIGILQPRVPASLPDTMLIEPIMIDFCAPGRTDEL